MNAFPGNSSTRPSGDVNRRLDEHGYAIIDGVLNTAELECMRRELDSLQRSESFLTGVNELTPWQGLALKSGRTISSLLANRFHRSVMILAERAAFRLRPAFKESLQNRIVRPPAPKGIWSRFFSEVLEACYTAAVQERGVTRVCNVLNKSVAFDRCITNPEVLSAVGHILTGDMKLSSLNFRAALPGGGLQPLHADWHEGVTPNRYFACNTLFVLDDFTPDNGPTRVVPGSHLRNSLPPGDCTERRQPHPQEIKLLAKAGSVIVLNSHIWHGGTTNHTATPRRILQTYYVRRGCRPQLDQASYVTRATIERLPEEARRLILV